VTPLNGDALRRQLLVTSYDGLTGTLTFDAMSQVRGAMVDARCTPRITTTQHRATRTLTTRHARSPPRDTHAQHATRTLVTPPRHARSTLLEAHAALHPTWPWPLPPPSQDRIQLFDLHNVQLVDGSGTYGAGLASLPLTMSNGWGVHWMGNASVMPGDGSEADPRASRANLACDEQVRYLRRKWGSHGGGSRGHRRLPVRAPWWGSHGGGCHGGESLHPAHHPSPSLTIPHHPSRRVLCGSTPPLAQAQCELHVSVRNGFTHQPPSFDETRDLVISVGGHVAVHSGGAGGGGGGTSPLIAQLLNRTVLMRAHGRTSWLVLTYAIDLSSVSGNEMAVRLRTRYAPQAGEHVMYSPIVVVRMGGHKRRSDRTATWAIPLAVSCAALAACCCLAGAALLWTRRLRWQGEECDHDGYTHHPHADPNP
jgi:hypothetical protein